MFPDTTVLGQDIAANAQLTQTDLPALQQYVQNNPSLTLSDPAFLALLLAVSNDIATLNGQPIQAGPPSYGSLSAAVKEGSECRG